ncbi:unnamed protein product, partial [Meganyctiphanes norvegica]
MTRSAEIGELEYFSVHLTLSKLAVRKLIEFIHISVHKYFYNKCTNQCCTPSDCLLAVLRAPPCFLPILGREGVTHCVDLYVRKSAVLCPNAPGFSEMRFIIPGFGLTRRIRIFHCINLTLSHYFWAQWLEAGRHTAWDFALEQEGVPSYPLPLSAATRPVGPKQQVHSAATRTYPDSYGPASGPYIHHAPWHISQTQCAWDMRHRHRSYDFYGDSSKLQEAANYQKQLQIADSSNHIRVSAVAVCGSEVYVGTTWGCVIVAEAASMRPITVFRPYEDEVRAIVPLPSFPKEAEASTGDSTPTEEAETVGMNGHPPLIATIGKGYRNLLGRYAPLPRSAQPDPTLQRTMYCLLWRAHDWLNTF